MKLDLVFSMVTLTRIFFIFISVFEYSIVGAYHLFSTIFKLYHGSRFYQWRKTTEYPLHRRVTRRIKQELLTLPEHLS